MLWLALHEILKFVNRKIIHHRRWFSRGKLWLSLALELVTASTYSSNWLFWKVKWIKVGKTITGAKFQLPRPHHSAINKVSPWRDVTLLARRDCPLVSYVAPWSVTDDRRQRAKQYWPSTLSVGGPVISTIRYNTIR